MNQEDIIRTAREIWGERAVLPFNELERFAALVAAHEREKWEQALPIAMDAMMLQEREACAKVCELIGQGGIGDIGDDTTVLCAAAIRARGE